jgi:hypothetical protein
MGTAYYPSFERDIPGYDPATAMSGKAIGRAMKELDAICNRLSVTPLSSFYSESNAEVFKKIGEPVPAGLKDNPIKWSEPIDALRTIDALLEWHRTNAAEPQVIQDLQNLNQALLMAAEHATRFRLRIDL